MRDSAPSRGAALLLGPPASGKTTLAEAVASRERVAVVQMGTLLKAQARTDDALGRRLKSFLARGEMVPTRWVEPVIRDYLKQVEERHVLFDGFPRTKEQMAPFFKLLQAHALTLRVVVVLILPVNKAVERLRHRRVCRQCGAVYNLIGQPPRRPGVCDRCGSELEQRQDDKPEVVRRRFEIFGRETQPVIEIFRREYPHLIYKRSGARPVPPAAQRISRWLEMDRTPTDGAPVNHPAMKKPSRPTE